MMLTRGETFTPNTIDRYRQDAGSAFLWDVGSKPGHRPSSAPRQALRTYLWQAQEGLCVFHNGAVDMGASHLCHIVSTGPRRRGWLPGNVAIGCPSCNATHASMGPVVEWPQIARPDLVVMWWPGMTDLVRMMKGSV